MVALLATGALVPAAADDGLARSKSCMNCHGFGGRIVGPGYREIAARHAGRPGAEQTQAERIRLGSSGQWGTTPMPPMEIDEQDALRLARWILSLAPQAR